MRYVDFVTLLCLRYFVPNVVCHPLLEPDYIACFTTRSILIQGHVRTIVVEFANSCIAAPGTCFCDRNAVFDGHWSECMKQASLMLVTPILHTMVHYET